MPSAGLVQEEAQWSSSQAAQGKGPEAQAVPPGLSDTCDPAAQQLPHPPRLLPGLVCAAWPVAAGPAAPLPPPALPPPACEEAEAGARGSPGLEAG